MTDTAVCPTLTATGLRKSLGDNVILDGIDLDICDGSVFSLLGPNGCRQDHRRTDLLDLAPP